MVYVKALFFLVLVPGVVALLAPWAVLRASGGSFEPVSGPLRVVALAGLGVGAVTYVKCVWDFAHRGGGTLFPTDPPRELVVNGFYRHVRNPMYVCAGIVLGSESLLFASPALLLYTLVMLTLYGLFVSFHEEPELRRRFGAPYEAYLSSVPRWLPRTRPYRPEGEP